MVLILIWSFFGNEVFSNSERSKNFVFKLRKIDNYIVRKIKEKEFKKGLQKQSKSISKTYEFAI
ncbi:hypothetical protein DQM68_08925 [Leptospira mayottensis]|uniref:Uncharacterized protein n=2 Tax=Leptospira mayottensis TaxID=1137606 RepID=A0AA87MMN1_9LEPT|nr:hypothetical protein DQM68_08925 [Leptospira mayottensis]AXR64657.1 hypothetical protein DQM28_10945 [Leptospira mayottensis]AZQ02782.1 hypothetical protein LEP1GSC190_12765 [Leptospira mayottensis 200901116]EKR99876.1 hypothetical protein LEP1GSC125_1630 [Leptospira mayottensis 200901122]TGN11540.1 hypothetical protein EHR03_06600 [Leptospira mayottensis]